MDGTEFKDILNVPASPLGTDNIPVKAGRKPSDDDNTPVDAKNEGVGIGAIEPAQEPIDDNESVVSNNE